MSSVEGSIGALLKIHRMARWGPGGVQITWQSNSQVLPPDGERLIEREWQRVRASGVHLFDGPMCRLESHSENDGKLLLSMSRTSYRIFVGTNLYNPQWADEYGTRAMANPVGVSSALVSSDNILILGRRNRSVAYYPDRVHPFAGALEPADPCDVFLEVRRELKEELRFGESDIRAIHCVALIEDRSLRHPELIFMVQSTRGRDQIEKQVDRGEHDSSYAIAPNIEEVGSALQQRELLTPVALATVLMWGREIFGAEWFDRHGAETQM